jgi:PAS domain S-box-containing protein
MDLSEFALDLLNSIDDVVVITNLKGAIIFINRRAEGLAGCMRQETAGRSMSAYWVGKVPWKKVFGKVLQTREIEELDGEFVDREGVKRVFRMRVIPLRDAGGETTAIGFTGRDITDFRDLEIERGEKSKALEGRIKEVDAFVSALCHDLRTPLISIQGFVNLVVKKYRDRMDEKGIEYLDRLKQEADRMDRLVQDLPRRGQVERKDGSHE